MDPRRLYWYCIHVIRTKIRPFMRPLSIDEAQEKRELFAKLYCTSAFLTLVYVTFKIGKDNANFNYGTNSPTPIDVINKLRVEGDVTILSFDGLKKVDEYIYNKDRPGEISRTNKPAEENLDVILG